MMKTVFRVQISLAIVAWAAANGLAGQPSDKADGMSHPENRWIKQSPREGAAVPRFSWEGSGSFDLYNRKWIHKPGQRRLIRYPTRVFSPPCAASGPADYRETA